MVRFCSVVRRKGRGKECETGNCDQHRRARTCTVLLDDLNRSDKTIPNPRQCLDEPRVLSVVPEGLAQFVHSGINAVFEVHEGIAGPELLPDCVPRHYLAGPLQEFAKNLARVSLELDLGAVVPHLTTSKVHLELSDPEARRRIGWHLHGELYQPCNFVLALSVRSSWKEV